MSTDTEIPEAVAAESARLERSSLALRVLSVPIAIVPFTIVMLTWGGTRPFDIIATFVFIYAICTAQLVSWRWREKVRGKDDGEHRYWWWFTIIFVVVWASVSVWYLIIEPMLG